MKTILFFVIFLSLCTCNHKGEISQNQNKSSVETLFFETNLLKLHEEFIENSKVDKFRVIVSTPFGGSMFASTIVNYDGELWLYSKKLTEQNNGHDYVEKLIVGKGNEYFDIWNEAITKTQTIPDVEMVDEPIISDNSFALLEIKIGNTITEREMIFCEDTGWIKELMQRIARDTIPLFIPKC